jgi:hypothetical protein
MLSYASTGLHRDRQRSLEFEQRKSINALGFLSQSLSLPHLGQFSLGRGLLCGGYRYLCRISMAGDRGIFRSTITFLRSPWPSSGTPFTGRLCLCNGKGRGRCISNAPVIWREVAKRPSFFGHFPVSMDRVLQAAPILYPASPTHGCCASLLVHSNQSDNW